LVVPTSTTSEAAAMVSGAAAFLISEAKARKVSLDELSVKAILMAGADRPTGWERGQPGPDDDSTVPLDYSFGAGVLRLDHSFDILIKGKRAPGAVPSMGWDLRTTGLARSKPNYYTFKTLDSSQFTAMLTWNRDIGVSRSLDLDASLANLDLILQHKVGGRWQTFASSLSDVDNVESITFDSLDKGNYRLGVFGDPNTQYGLAWTTLAPVDGGDGGDDGGTPDQGLTTPAARGVHAVPEPGTGMFLLAAAGLLLRRRRGN